jgi:zinc knuckle protein
MNALRQGSNSVEEYSGQFLDISANIDWQDAPLINSYHLGLALRIKNEMGSRDPPASLAEAITLATRAEHRLWEMEREQVMEKALSRISSETASPHSPQPSTTMAANPNPNAMEVDATQRSKGRSSEWTCHYCKKPGHFIADCRKRLSRERLKARGQSPQ